jgi:hypothetical protein
MVLGFGIGISTVIYNRRFLSRFGARGPSMVALLNAIFAAGAIGAPLVFVALGSNPQLAYLVVAALAAVTFLVARDAPPVATAQGGGPFSPHPGILAFGAVAVGMEASLIGLGPVALIALGQSEAGAAQALSAFYVSSVRIMGEHPRVTPTVIAAGLAGGISAPVILGAVMARAGDAVLFPCIAGMAAVASLAALGGMARAAA